MYLFTRTTRLQAGNARDGMPWAVAITEKVNQVTSLDVGLWATMFSPEVGRLTWTATVSDLVALDTANTKLMADDMYLEQVVQGAKYGDGHVDDQLAQIIHGEPDPNRRPKYAAVVRSVLANGQFERGIAVGVEIAQRASELGGLPTSFLLSTTGPYAGCAWVTVADTLPELEAAEQAVNTNMDFVKFLDDKASACYLPGVTVQSIFQRVV